MRLTHSHIPFLRRHMLSQDMVLGHEGVGIVSRVGPLVKNFKVGDRVGWGYNHGNCGNICKFCLKGKDTLCSQNRMYGNEDLDQASFGDRFVIDAEFAHHIPDGLELRDAAPLMCGGATVYGAIKAAQIPSHARVGVLGVGGLGHLAIQYLAKMGCDVVVFSGTDSKKDEATKLGATDFVAMKTNPTLEGVEPVQYLLVTTSAQPNWKTLIPVLEKEATILPLSVAFNNFTFPYMPIIGMELKIQGSLVAGRGVHKEMIEVTAKDGVRPMIEELPMTLDGLKTAFDRLKKGDVRYRFVLRNEKNCEKAGI
ncbi:putative NADP-dependent alcohol dehydrogenase [Violaceomyces palustris]|uniref:NADP-dependent alcohol dehydrogenase n=1 Tax=Violaceomyces palustris TaxID=1673888 RepID=A0ACD0NWA7_9BASI|nr:putative NADP-dependent alcohol dehydrogenase [Violaceomyces palustris]